MALFWRCTSLMVIVLTILVLPLTVVGQSQCNNVTLVATGSSKYITSPNYPFKYPNNTSCRWNIIADQSTQVVALKVLDFHLQEASPCNLDYVSLHDGFSDSFSIIHTLCGYDPRIQQFRSTGSSMSVVFHSDASVNFRGFKLEYTSMSKTDVTAECNNETIVMSGSSKFITSPNYPSNYSSDTVCQWNITAPSGFHVVVLKVLEINLELQQQCLYDSLTMYNGPSTKSPLMQTLCNENLPPTTHFISNGAYMTVVFRSDSSGNRKGFKLEYSFKEKQEVTAQCNNQAILMSGSSKFITSPNYPSNYSSNTVCQWNIGAPSGFHVVVLKVLEINLELQQYCRFDNLTMYNGPSTRSPLMQKLCNESLLVPTHFISKGPYMTVAFHSDTSVNRKGFKLEYSFKEKQAECNSGLLTAVANSPQFITSPNYPFSYPSNIYCRWHITSGSYSSRIVLQLIEMDIKRRQPNGNNDYVEIYDGPSIHSPLMQVLYGNINNGMFVSTSSDITIVFVSFERSYLYTGFNFTYQTQEQQVAGNATDKNTSPQDSCYRSTDVKFIASGVGCSLIGTFLAAINVVCLHRRKKKHIKSAQNRTKAPDVRCSGL